jgi:hypothetical protein
LLAERRGAAFDERGALIATRKSPAEISAGLLMIKARWLRTG